MKLACNALWFAGLLAIMIGALQADPIMVVLGYMISNGAQSVLIERKIDELRRALS